MKQFYEGEIVEYKKHFDRMATIIELKGINIYGHGLYLIEDHEGVIKVEVDKYLFRVRPWPCPMIINKGERYEQ